MLLIALITSPSTPYYHLNTWYDHKKQIKQFIVFKVIEPVYPKDLRATLTGTV